jgi:hypothetical protein
VEARAREQDHDAGDETARQAEQRLDRAARGAERDEVLDALDLLAGWYRDLVVVGAGAEHTALNSDRLDDLRADALPERARAAESAVEACREAWRVYEELNLQQNIALEALFIRLRRVLAAGLVPVSHT